MIIQMRFPESASDITSNTDLTSNADITANITSNITGAPGTTGIPSTTATQAGEPSSTVAKPSTGADVSYLSTNAFPKANADEPLRISCGDCRMVKTSVCDDCVVTHLLDRFDALGVHGTASAHIPGVRPVAPVVLLDGEELSTLRMLQAAGMAPQNRHVARHPSARSAGGLVAV